MAKQLSKEELDRIAEMEKAYSPKNIRASNRMLKLRVLEKRLADIDAWREEQLQKIQQEERK
jgi:hypothetical protein